MLNLFCDTSLSKLKAVFSSSTRKEAGKVDNHIAYGGYVLISAIARKTGCYEILKKVFPKHYKLILALCSYGVSEGNLISQQFSSWCFGHYCGLDRTVSDSEGCTYVFLYNSPIDLSYLKAASVDA
jgi:hypothetical protein